MTYSCLTFRFGSNENKPRRIKTLCELILENFEDFILKVLCVAAVVTLILGIWQEGWEHGWIDGVSIIMAVVIITAVTAGNNYAKEKQFQELQKKQDQATAIVIRSGHILTIDSQELVVGDIVQIEWGKQVPADCVLIDSVTMTNNESGLTGEPDALPKSHVTSENLESNPCPFILKSALVETGSGTAIVTAVGYKTRAGRADKCMDVESELTPLQEKLEIIANQIGMLGVYAALLTVIAMWIRIGIKLIHQNSLSSECDATVAASELSADCAEYATTDADGNITYTGFQEFLSQDTLSQVLESIVLGLSIIVCAVPEGLPLAVTIALAFSVGKMFEQHNLVRKLQASETMGGANEICTDKTGTLTQNKMTVQALFVGDEVIKGEKDNDFTSKSYHDVLAQTILYNCTAYVESEGSQKVAKGNASEVGLINYLLKSGFDAQAMLANKNADNFNEFEIPFNSTRKRATCAIQHPDGSGRIRVFMKGAPDMCLTKCETFLRNDGEHQDLSQDDKDEILGNKVIKTFAS